jgi:hypothetical protein
MHRRAPHGWDFVQRGVTGSVKMKGKHRASTLSLSLVGWLLLDKDRNVCHSTRTLRYNYFK